MVTALAMARDGFVVVADYSEGSLAGTNKAGDDFFEAKIDPNSGKRLWLWQASSWLVGFWCFLAGVYKKGKRPRDLIEDLNPWFGFCKQE